MRIKAVLLLCAAGGVLAACETATSPRNAIPASVTAGGSNNNGTLVISPSQATMGAGTSLQLATNASSTQSNQTSGIFWTSSSNAIATVTQSGLVTAISPGAVTIFASFSSDLINPATATITVTP